MTHTHAGCRSQVGYVHSGAKLWGHRIPREGEVHALNGGPDHFRALCGKEVYLQRFNEWGEEATPNVRPIDHPEAAKVTCKRCLALIARGGKKESAVAIGSYVVSTKRLGREGYVGIITENGFLQYTSPAQKGKGAKDRACQIALKFARHLADKKGMS